MSSGSMEKEKRVLVMRVRMGMLLGDEILGFEEILPFLTHTLESDNGFDGKPCENVGD